MPKLELRDYQEECVERHYSFMAENPGHPLFVVPTGGGKSLVLAEFIKRSTDLWPETRILVVTHVKELIRQNYLEFCDHVGASPWAVGKRKIGIYSAGLGRREVDCNVLFAGIQSIWKKAHRLGHFDLVLIDEAHLVPKKGIGRYRHYLEELRKINPKLRICGYTATHYRLDGGYLHKGDGRVFTDVAYEVSVTHLIEEGYLVPPVSKDVQAKIDTSDVKTSAGDFNRQQLEQAAMREGLVAASVAETLDFASRYDRKHMLFFAAGVDHAKEILDELDHAGVEARAVFGHTPKEERDETVDAFRNAELPALVNVGVLTTGFNAPCCDLMAVMRPTQSTALYVQIIGRGMRTYPGKENCIVLDFGGNVERHGPINRVKVRGKGEGPPPTKVCPACDSIVLSSMRFCPECGYLFDFKPREVTHAEVASALKPWDPAEESARTYDVTGIFFRLHVKEGKPDSMRIDYICGMKTFSEWVCIEHGGFAGRKATKWWLSNGGEMPVPITTQEAINRSDEIRAPVEIVVTPDGEFDRVSRLIHGERDEPLRIREADRDQSTVFEDGWDPNDQIPF